MAAPRNDNVKEKILNATETLLQKKDLSDITLSEIAIATGISKGTLYYYYKNKTDIYMDITARYLDQQWKDFIAWTENKEKDTSITRLINYVVQRNIASYRTRLHLINAASLGDEDLREKLVSLYKEMGFSEEQIDRLVVLDLKDQAWFDERGIRDQHGGGGSFAHEADIMGWLFGEH